MSVHMTEKEYQENREYHILDHYRPEYLAELRRKFDRMGNGEFVFVQSDFVEFVAWNIANDEREPEGRIWE
jgi:hypothetical protein